MREVFASLLANADSARIAISDDRGVLDFAALALRVAAVAASLPASADTIAIVGRGGASWIVADLAATLAGRRVVPVPSFFSREQVRHVLADSAVQRLLCCDTAVDSFWGDFRLPIQSVDAHVRVSDSAQALQAYAGGAERVIYTSGTTGTPKGVVHGDRQMGHAIQAISAAVAAAASDIHLSSLPASLLLEQIAGVFIPLLVGGRVHVSATATEAAMTGDLRPLLALFGELAPSTTVLVPQLLAAMTAAARNGQWTPAPSLRVAAVGGAPIPLNLVREARAAGIPVIRGYGLSECASVVAVERPGAPVDDTDGACGTVLDGVLVNVINGEVVVSGPTVMNGYLNAAPLSSSVWHTGDKGRLEGDGTVVITGRCDRVLVLPSGRNVASDWVEAIVLADPCYQSARVLLADDGVLQLDAAIRPECARWLSAVDEASLRAHLCELFAELPGYARPARIELACAGESGAFSRATEFDPLTAPTALRDSIEHKETTLPDHGFYARLLAATAPARDEFLNIPIIVTALHSGVGRTRYLNYLGEAYHHVRHTVPLLAAALARCAKNDDPYRDALIEYIEEERGHEQWILNDIVALGGDAESVRAGEGGDAVRVMVGYAYHVIEHVSPYGLLGMVHVLEGMSVALAQRAAASIGQLLAEESGRGFSYLTSHGALDQEHVAFFARLVNGIDDSRHQHAIIDTARIVYRLFGAVFHALDVPCEEARDAA